MNHYLQSTDNESEDTFKTCDLYLSAYFCAQGLRIVTIDRSNPQRCNFIFEKREDIDDLIETFKLGQARVEPKQYMFKIRELKSMLYINKKYPIKNIF